jgi:hypothetical protein
VLKQPRTKKVEKSRKPVETTLSVSHLRQAIAKRARFGRLNR